MDTAKAKFAVVRAAGMTGAATPSQVRAAQTNWLQVQKERNDALTAHTNSLVEMNDFQSSDHGEVGGGNDPYGNGSGNGSGNPYVGPNSSNSGEGGDPSSSSSSSGSEGGTYENLPDDHFGTHTSGDDDPNGNRSAMTQPSAAQQPGQGQGQGAQPGGGSPMGGGMPGGTGAPGAKLPKDKKKKDDDIPTYTSAADGANGAAIGGVALNTGSPTGSSVGGVHTKSDTSGVNPNSVRATGANPNGGAAGGAGMGRGGMMGMGSGAGMGGSSGKGKEKADIKSSDRPTYGQNEVDGAVGGGVIGRDTSEVLDDDGWNDFLRSLKPHQDKKAS